LLLPADNLARKGAITAVDSGVSDATRDGAKETLEYNTTDANASHPQDKSSCYFLIKKPQAKQKFRVIEMQRLVCMVTSGKVSAFDVALELTDVSKQTRVADAAILRLCNHSTDRQSWRIVSS
jgi:hypothetical protein